MTSWFNPNPRSHVHHEDAFLTFEFALDHFSHEFAINTVPGMNVYPATYCEAMSRADNFEWWNAIELEFSNSESKNVWRIIKKSNLSKGRKPIGNRWVYVQKDGGRFRARTVGKGLSQVPGKDFQENHAPVGHDRTVHMIFVVKIIYRLSSRHFDIETAFLYGVLDEEIYMVFPDGYERYLKEKGLHYTAEEHCLLLLKALYGLV